MKTPKRRYVVGYPGDHQVAYGARHFPNTRVPKDLQRIGDYAHRMTAWQALQAQRAMPCAGAQIFELVPVDPKKLERRQ